MCISLICLDIYALLFALIFYIFEVFNPIIAFLFVQLCQLEIVLVFLSDTPKGLGQRMIFQVFRTSSEERMLQCDEVRQNRANEWVAAM